MAVPTAVVLDSSAALEPLLPDSERRFDLAHELVSKISAAKLVAHVPIIFFNEVAAGCARAVRGGRVKRPTAVEFLEQMGRMPVILSIEINPAAYWFDRAMRFHCQVADSAYLALALDLKAPIATFDSGLATAARSQKVRAYFPASD